MGLFEQFPYSNFHGLNLDWILKTIKDLETQISEFVSINSIKYADPIIWNITTQYEKNTVVLDVTGDGYISVKPVPSGISIDRTEYWTKIGNFSALWGGVKKSITPEDEGHSSTATKPRNVGDLVWLNDILVEITTAISVGSAYIVGSNCRVYSMQILLTEIQNEIIAEQTARANADTTLQNSIINETTLRTNADTTLQTNITTETTERKAAITEESQARETSDNNLQTRVDQYRYKPK
jgi:hypothetical protein